MEKVLNLYKKAGETPLECLSRFRKSHPEYADVALSYVGRLDPLAEGVLLVVVGEENKNRELYLHLEKEYDVEVLFGMETDTGDCLGMVTANGNPNPDMQHISDILKSCEGKQIQVYPTYSSKTVRGKPLHEWARENKLSEIEIPSHEIVINSIELKKTTTIDSKKLHEEIIQKINSVHGDFRQEKILASWEKFFKKQKAETYTLMKIHVSCGSGAYMRVLSGKIGEKLGTNALAYQIYRRKVGEYEVDESDRT